LINISYYIIYIFIFSFYFSASDIKIKAPKSKEKLKIGTNYQIKWKTNKNIQDNDKIKIFISFDSGNNWELIAITENDGIYNWEVPSKNSKNCLIKIQNIDNSSRAISKKEFKIDGPEINILSPNKGDFFSGGDKVKIIWESKNLGNELINIDYSNNNGYSWNSLATNIVDIGLYVWDVPHFNEIYENCLIKISSNSNKTNKISSNFTIIDKSNKIRITYPNGGELIESGKAVNIKWKSNGLKANLFKILYSQNSGNTWNRIESRILNVNEYLWITPNIESEDCLIKIISVENDDIYDISEKTFKISKNPSIKISNPLSDQVYYSKEGIPIRWNSVNVRGKKVNIYYSANKGKRWNVIKRGVLNNGKFDWDISEIDTTSTFSKIKIELSNNIKINDVNKGYFTVYGKPYINILTQKDNQIIEDKTIYRIEWNSKNIRENRINIYYSIDGANIWNPIEMDISNKGFYDWFIPNLNAEKCFFKVESAIENNIFSVSNYSINITDKPSIIIKNNLNDLKFGILDSILINWETYNLSDEYIDILYSEDLGKNWKLLHKNVFDSGEKIIKVPFVSESSKECQIKISDSDNDKIYTISKGVFEIERPKGTINLSNLKKKKYNYDDIMEIVWTDEYMDDRIGKIYYSINNGKDWEFINEVKISEGSLNWEIPNLEIGSKECLIKIVVNNSNYDFIDNLKDFEIKPAPFINIVNNSNEIINTDIPFLIQVSSKNVKKLSYNLYYSFTRGISWKTIDKNIKSTEYLWNVPSIKGYKNVLLKAELNNFVDIQDVKKMPTLGQSINISVLKPNGEELYSVNDKVEIVWNIKKIYDKTIDIYYSLDSGLSWEVIEKNVENSGNYIWSIIDKSLDSKNCKIKIQSNIDNNIFDVSDGLFSIKKADSFNIITPNGNDIIHRGTSTFIYWDSLDKSINSVSIFYSLDNGKNWFLIKDNLNNNGKYNWAVPNDISKSNQCLIKIASSQNNLLVDYSDKIFTIK